MIGVIKIS